MDKPRFSPLDLGFLSPNKRFVFSTARIRQYSSLWDYSSSYTPPTLLLVGFPSFHRQRKLAVGHAARVRYLGEVQGGWSGMVILDLSCGRCKVLQWRSQALHQVLYGTLSNRQGKREKQTTIILGFEKKGFSAVFENVHYHNGRHHHQHHHHPHHHHPLWQVLGTIQVTEAATF